MLSAGGPNQGRRSPGNHTPDDSGGLKTQFLERGAIRPQPVRGDRFWLHGLIAQQTPEKSQRGLGVARRPARPAPSGAKLGLD
jgi:hypothetical protein